MNPSVRVPIGSGALLAAMLCVGTARAQDTSQRTLAETLFREAKQLMDSGRYTEACPKFAESQHLDPGGGTLLNLALCHEKQGRTATAWTEFHEALSQAKQEARADRQEFAQQHLSALEPKLATLKVSVPESARVRGMVIRVGRAILPEAAWGTSIPVDPGLVLVEAAAPEHRSWSKQFEAQSASSFEVKIAPLAKGDSGSAKGQGRHSNRTPDQGTKQHGSQAVWGYVVGAAGIVALGIGTYYGIRAITKRSQSDKQCPSNQCTVDGVRLNNEAKTSARISDVTVGLGLVGIGVGTYLVLSSPSSQQQTQERAARASVWLSVTGRW